MKIILYYLLFFCFIGELIGQTTYTGVFRSNLNGTDYHHLVRNNSAGAALYVNQVDPSATSRILQLSSGTAQPAQGIKFTVMANGRVGILTVNPDAELTVKGDIHAEEVRVDLSVPAPDYVFKSDYKLKSLEEVKKYIEENGHLPEIPSGIELEDKGIAVGEMNMLLLKKIEELTLYQLQLLEIVNKQKEDLSRLKKQIVNPQTKQEIHNEN
ncbi:hypothetical protein [Leeuwenhoekiella sp. H156]|uniref:hypothetical protein n=1 Tax=Leeuwenhoekiella sp. H156 TaxID=3450128 RepID=UPI003FA49CD4